MMVMCSCNFRGTTPIHQLTKLMRRQGIDWLEPPQAQRL